MNERQAMSLMSKQMNLPQIQRILQDFEKESSMMDMKEEMMSDSIDDVMEDEGEGEEAEEDRILDEVLAEIGISVGQQVSYFVLHPAYSSNSHQDFMIPQLGDAPTTAPPMSLGESNQKMAIPMGEGGASSSGGGEVDELQARLDNLRKD
jgi:charged multivesicular body protein 2A